MVLVTHRTEDRGLEGEMDSSQVAARRWVMTGSSNVWVWAPSEENEKEWERMSESDRAFFWIAQRAAAECDLAEWCEEVYQGFRWQRRLVDLSLASVEPQKCPMRPPPKHLCDYPPLECDGPPCFRLTWAGVATLVAVACAVLGAATYLLFV